MNREKLDEFIKEVDNKLPKGHNRIEITDNTELLIEGCNKVKEYDENIVCLCLSKLKLTITGIDLVLENYDTGYISVLGSIHSLEFEEEN